MFWILKFDSGPDSFCLRKAMKFIEEFLSFKFLHKKLNLINEFCYLSSLKMSHDYLLKLKNGHGLSF